MSSIQFLSLIPGRWKGISFLVSQETIQAIGQRYIQHDYPGTNIRYMEAHGKAPFQATMSITFSGITFKEDFRNFKRAMEDPSPGTLYLPTLGVFTNIVAMQADAVSDQSNFGEIPLTVTFTETVLQPSPTSATASQEDVFNQGAISITAIENSFASSYLTPVSVNNANTVLGDIASIGKIIQQLTGAGAIGATITNKLAQNINSPSGLASFLFDSSTGLFALISTAVNNLSNAYIATKQLAVSGNTLSNTMQDINSNFILKQVGTPPAVTINFNINVWPGTTFEQQQRNINRYSIVNAFRMAGLVLLCEQSGLQVFTTVNQVQSVIADIQNYFNALIENDTSKIIINDVKANMEALKNDTISTLYSLQQQLSKTTQITLEKPMSPRVLAYELYGEFMLNSNDLDNYTALLISLNNAQPAHLFSGQITIAQV